MDRTAADRIAVRGDKCTGHSDLAGPPHIVNQKNGRLTTGIAYYILI